MNYHNLKMRIINYQNKNLKQKHKKINYKNNLMKIWSHSSKKLITISNYTKILIKKIKN